MVIKIIIIFEVMEYDFKIKTNTTGFSSPAENYVDKRLNPADLLVKNQFSTYYLRASGNKFQIREGDILVVDRSITPSEERIVVVDNNGRLELERFSQENKGNVWGTVTFVIKEI